MVYFAFIPELTSKSINLLLNIIFLEPKNNL